MARDQDPARVLLLGFAVPCRDFICNETAIIASTDGDVRKASGTMQCRMRRAGCPASILKVRRSTRSTGWPIHGRRFLLGLTAVDTA